MHLTFLYIFQNQYTFSAYLPKSVHVNYYDSEALRPSLIGNSLSLNSVISLDHLKKHCNNNNKKQNHFYIAKTMHVSNFVS